MMKDPIRVVHRSGAGDGRLAYSDGNVCRWLYVEFALRGLGEVPRGFQQTRHGC